MHLLAVLDMLILSVFVLGVSIAAITMLWRSRKALGRSGTIFMGAACTVSIAATFLPHWHTSLTQ